jgi:hypothetical protein
MAMLASLVAERDIRALVTSFFDVNDNFLGANSDYAEALLKHFTPKGVWAGAGGFESFGTSSGTDALRRRFLSRRDRFPFSIHFLSNERIVVDGQRANGHWYCFEPATARTGEDTAAVWIFGAYHIEFERTSNGWLMDRMSYTDMAVASYAAGWATDTKFALPVPEES